MGILVFILLVVIMGLLMYTHAEYKNRKFYQHRVETLKEFNKPISPTEFNRWFVNNKNKEFYAHGGIFLRLDKLSKSHIVAFLYAKKNPHNLSHDTITELSFISYSNELYMEKIIRDNWHELNESDKDFQTILNYYLDN